MSAQNKAVVRRVIDEVMNAGRMDLIDELYLPRLAPVARRWIAPFRASFPDMQMEVVRFIAEGDQVVWWFTCSGAHLGEWRGHPPTGRRLGRIDETYFFGFHEGRITHAWGLEDTLGCFDQLGLR